MWRLLVLHAEEVEGPLIHASCPAWYQILADTVILVAPDGERFLLKHKGDTGKMPRRLPPPGEPH